MTTLAALAGTLLALATHAPDWSAVAVDKFAWQADKRVSLAFEAEVYRLRQMPHDQQPIEADLWVNGHGFFTIDRSAAVTPDTFLNEGGDCKDFVVTKATMLWLAGWSFRQMVQVELMAGGTRHVVLIADGLVLDSFYPIWDAERDPLHQVTAAVPIAKGRFAGIAPLAVTFVSMLDMLAPHDLLMK